MKKKVKIFNPQYAQGGITQDDIQRYLMSMQQQQPQVTEDNLVDMIYSELTSLGDDAGFVDASNIDNLADQIRSTYNLDNDYVYNLVNEVYSTLAPSDYKSQQTNIAKGTPTSGLNMGEESDDYQEDLEDENLEENVSTYDDYYGDDTGLSEMKFGGMQKKKFIRDFIKKAQEGMEQTDQSVIGNNDTKDGRASLVKGFESGVKSAVVKAVAKNQFDKMKQQMSYFQDGGFYDPNNLGDEEAYAHHLNLMAAANKDIFNQPELTTARDGREQRRAAREQRRVGRDVQKVLNNLPGMYPGGFNVYSMPGQIMPDMGQLSQGMPPFTIEGERNIFGGLKSYKASFEGGLPVNYMAGMMMPGRGRRGLFASASGYPASFYGQSAYGTTPGEIIYETVNKEALKEVDKNTPSSEATKVEEKVEEKVQTAGSEGTVQASTPQQTPVVQNQNANRVQVPLVEDESSTIVPAYTPEKVDRKALLTDLEKPGKKPGKNYKEWQTKDGGRAISYEGTYTTGMFGTKRPARYQVVYKPDGTIDKKKSFVAVSASSSPHGSNYNIYVPWDKQGTFWYEEGGAVNNPMPDQFGNLQKFVYGGYDPSVAELDGTNLVDPSDPYTRRFSNGGTKRSAEYQKYIDWYNESAPAQGMSRAPQQSYDEWIAENYPNEKVSQQTIVPRYNPNFNPQLAAEMMSSRMGYPIQTLGRSISPISIQRQMVQKGMPMIAGTNIPFTAALGPDARISEIYTDPRRFGKDALHVKFMVPGQEGPMLGMDWQQQVQQPNNLPQEMGRRDMRRDVLDQYTRSNVGGLEDESRVSIRAGERDQRRNVRRALRRDPNAFYEGAPQEGMITPMSDAEYMAKVKANRPATAISTQSNIDWNEPWDEDKMSQEDRAKLAWQKQGIKYDSDHKHTFPDGTPANYNYDTGRYEVDKTRTKKEEPKAEQPKKVEEPTKSKEEKVKPSKESVPSSTQVSSSKPDKVKKEKEATEPQYKSKRAALNAAFGGVDPYDVKMYGPDYIKKKQIQEEAFKQGDVWKKMPRNTISEMEAAHAFFDKELNPRYAQLGELRNSTSNYYENTSNKDKRKNYRQFKKEAKSKAQEGGFIPDYMAYGGTPMYPDGGFVYNNPVDNRENPVMSDKDFFSVNTNQNTIPDYLEWQSTPQQEVDVEYQQKNKLQFSPKGLFPFIGKGARNLRNRFDANTMDKFNTQNMMTSSGREQADELVSQGMYDINTGKEIISGFEGIVGAGKGVGQQYYSKFGGQLDYEEGGEYDLSEEEIQALIDAGVDLTLLEDYED